MYEAEEYDIFLNKRTDKVYLSKSIDVTQIIPSREEGVIEMIRPIRYVSMVRDSEQHEFVKINEELAIRVTPNARQEISAKFYEDTRGIFTLQIQKYTLKNGSPHNTYFTFVGDEILKLYNFIRNIPFLPINNNEKQQFQESILNSVVLSKRNILKFIYEQPEIIPELIEELQKFNIKHEDIKGLAFKKEQLEIFRQMLDNEAFFEDKKKERGIISDELLWQRFFEINSWILGYGLNYVFNSELDEKKLEQVVSGFDFNSSGKRVDLLMKTKGLINSLCFGEIKTHKTELLKKTNNPYRKECWQVSEDLVGGIAQIQRTVQKSIENIKTKTEIKDKLGYLTGEQVYLYQPKSFLLIGSLNQFVMEDRVNEDKYSSFELFRKNLFNPEIITFDELYERARHIVNNPLIESE